MREIPTFEELVKMCNAIEHKPPCVKPSLAQYIYSFLELKIRESNSLIECSKSSSFGTSLTIKMLELQCDYLKEYCISLNGKCRDQRKEIDFLLKTINKGENR